MLLNNQNTNELVSIFMEHRQTALVAVINISHPSVRVQIAAMVKCLITTIHLLYECFMSKFPFLTGLIYIEPNIIGGSNNGLIFKQLNDILDENSKPTFDKLKIPESPLIAYIPQIIKEFR